MPKHYPEHDGSSFKANGAWDNPSIAMNVWPVSLYDLAKRAKTTGDDLAHQLEAIIKAMDSITWVGLSSEQSADMNRRWTSVVTVLFGSEKHPEDGTLNRFMTAVQMAAGNFGNAETAIYKYWNNAFQFGGGEKGSRPPQLPPILQTDFA